jgi:transcriptional regulator with XRE-family HTH domain
MGKLHDMTDSAVLAELGLRLARVRLRKNLAQAELADEAGVSKRTLIRLEHGESTQLTNLIRVLRALGLLENLDALVPPPGPSPMEQLRMRRRERQRASPKGTARGPAKPWTWADDEGER